MLRFLYTISDLLAGLLAIVSPVAIIHWLARATGVAALKPFIDALNPVFEPLNLMLEFFWTPPMLTFNDAPVATTQGVLAVLMTVGFFAFNFLSETLKATEQRLDVARQAGIQRRRMQQMQQEQSKQDRKISTNRRIYLVVSYDFLACADGGTFFQQGYRRHRGKLVDEAPHELLLQFDNLEYALEYSLEAAQSILSYYATLRPVDPQPPYRLAIEAIESATSKPDAVARTRKLVSYADGNQVVFSQDIKSMLDVLGLSTHYQYQSLGMYSLNNREQELFCLYYQKRQ